MSSAWKLAFMGAPGAGKSTCVAAISDIPPVVTDVATDELAGLKETTTVALDYGELDLGADGRLLLYGLPGQTRFRHMFDVVRENLLGVALLVDGTADDPLQGLRETLHCYAADLKGLPCVLCLNKQVVRPEPLLRACRDQLASFGLKVPVLAIDARRREDVVRVFELLFVLIEQAGPEHPAPEPLSWH